MKIGAQDKTPATGYDSAHYLMAWYTAWGGGIGASWAWKIGCSHAHFGYQNPFQGWVSATQSDFAPKSSTVRETGQQATRDSLNSISGCSRLKVVLPVSNQLLER